MLSFKEKIKQFFLRKDVQAKLIFFFSGFIFIALTYIFFLYDFKGNEFFNSRFRNITYISKNLERNFKEKDLILKFEGKTFSTNKEEEDVLLENFDPRITNNKNLIYISKNAEDKDFKEKDTFAILNSKELKINIEPPLIYPIENFESISSVVSYNEIKTFNERFFEGSDLYNTAAFNLIMILKSIEVFILLIVASFLIPFLVRGVLYFSGYKNLKTENYRNNSIIAFGLFLIIKPILIEFLFEPSFISVLLIITVLVSIQEKNKIEKN